MYECEGGDMSNKNLVMNNMTINLSMRGELMKGGILYDENGCLIIVVHFCNPLHRITKLLE